MNDSLLSLDDDQLIKDTLAGQTEAFGQLVQKHQNALMDLALRMAGNREEAEDVIQQVFVEAYRHLADFRHGSQFFTWLYSITLNRARNLLRSRKIRMAVSLDEKDTHQERGAPLQLPDKSPTPEKIAETQFDLEWIRVQVQALPEEYRDIFTLRYFQDLSLNEVAKRLGKPLGTVKVYLHRARKELCKRAAKPTHRLAKI